ncbi:Rieske (2Fe-2S) protein [Marinobacterium sp. MBR-109]|uniref:Rieske (2Fe-2S) protein n=1 Tax=Marinobacterium sp. MBR-109 TaxID=3156462 RepID=UPI0033917AFD
MKICTLDDLMPDTPRGFDLDDGTALLLIRRGDRVIAWRNSCPHRGIRLEWQPDQFLDYEKQFIQCATHGALFGIEDGICIAGPCPGEQLEALSVEVRDGEVWLRLD